MTETTSELKARIEARIAETEAKAAANYKAWRMYSKNHPQSELLALAKQYVRINNFSERTSKTDLINALVDDEFGYSLNNLDKQLKRLASK